MSLFKTDDTQVLVGGITVYIYEKDSYEVVAMKVKSALEGKEFIETEHTVSGQKLLISEN